MQILLISLFVIELIVESFLKILNLGHLKRYGSIVPEGFEEYIDSERLKESTSYSLAQSRVGWWETAVGSIGTALFFFGGLLPWYDRFIAAQGLGFIGSGILFAAGLIIVQTIIQMPFNLYSTFVLEERFGFNNSTLKLWLTDTLKSLVIGMILLSIVVSAALWLVASSPTLWWFYLWIFLALFTLLLMYLSPNLIEPLFFKFEPVQSEELQSEVTSLMERAGLKVAAVQQVDASRRSGHSNAYFTGIGKTKRIVLFDTLIEQMDIDEIVAVLAHEVGHWQKGHVRKRLIKAELFSFVGCWLLYQAVNWGGLAGLIGAETLSFYAECMIATFVASLVLFPASPMSSWFSRRDEWQADAVAVELTGSGGGLARALMKMAKENLANLHPHPWYAIWHFSHPPLAERVHRLIKR